MTYRVIRLTTNDFGAYRPGKPSVITEAVIWTGPSVERMSEQFPPSSVYDADPLGHSEIEDGLIRFDYRFEQGYGEDWEEIPDPRVRLDQALSSSEKAQNAENRRLYPGDFYGTPCLNCGSEVCLGGCYRESGEDEEEYLGWCVYCKESFCEGECQDEEYLDLIDSP